MELTGVCISIRLSPAWPYELGRFAGGTVFFLGRPVFAANGREVPLPLELTFEAEFGFAVAFGVVLVASARAWFFLARFLLFLFLITSDFNDRGLMVPCSFWNSPHALQRVFPWESRLQRGVLSVLQFEHCRGGFFGRSVDDEVEPRL